MIGTLSKRIQKIWDEFSDEEKSEIDARYHELRREYMTLQEIRNHRHVTQEDLAELLGIKQGNISRMEHRSDMRLSTLREYIEALGGHIEINAVFPDNEVISIINSPHEQED